MIQDNLEDTLIATVRSTDASGLWVEAQAVSRGDTKWLRLRGGTTSGPADEPVEIEVKADAPDWLHGVFHAIDVLHESLQAAVEAVGQDDTMPPPAEAPHG